MSARPGDSRVKPWKLGVIVALASTVFTLGLMEVVLHVLDLPREQVGHQRIFVEHDSLLGWRNSPNRTGRISTDEYVRDLAYNERSMRGPVRPYEKPEGTYRIVLVGDSFVDGYTEELGDRVGDVLERLLNQDAPGRPVEVISLGAGGYSTDQELLWLESEGLRYQPDLVVLLFYANDIWYNVTDRYWRGGKPMFALRGDSLALTGVPVPLPGAEPPPPQGAFARVNRWVRANSKLYWLLARFVQNQPRLYGLAVRIGLTGPSPEMVFDAGRGEVIAGEFSVFLRDPPPEVEQAWKVTDALVARMRDDAMAAGAEFLAFLVPFRGGIYTQGDDVRSEPGESGTIDASAVERRFARTCVTESLACIDPTDAFKAEAERMRADGERLYYRYDWHWNRNGHALAAGILADSVRGRRRS